MFLANLQNLPQLSKGKRTIVLICAVGTHLVYVSPRPTVVRCREEPMQKGMHKSVAHKPVQLWHSTADKEKGGKHTDCQGVQRSVETIRMAKLVYDKDTSNTEAAAG